MQGRSLWITLTLAGLGSIATAGAARAGDLERFGRIATLASLCSVRDEAWSFDLRRAELQTATGSARFDDDALRAAPGSQRAVAALSSAEHEAIEEFTEDLPARSCEAVRADADLRHGDEIVRAFRAQRERQSGS